MAPRKRKKVKGVMSKVRKPMAPPSKVEEAMTTYRRERERERLRRERENVER
ncbi:MAG: hypothetical protein ACREQF_12325 [Candidatus Binataceae bacterium]